MAIVVSGLSKLLVGELVSTALEASANDAKASGGTPKSRLSSRDIERAAQVLTSEGKLGNTKLKGSGSSGAFLFSRLESFVPDAAAGFGLLRGADWGGPTDEEDEGFGFGFGLAGLGGFGAGGDSEEEDDDDEDNENEGGGNNEVDGREEIRKSADRPTRPRQSQSQGVSTAPPDELSVLSRACAASLS